MSSEADDTQAFHGRADHEDNLLVSRTDLFVSFNGFLAVAVGFADLRPLKLVFAILALCVDAVWCVWAPRARKFIRALRDAGGRRVDEKLYVDVLGKYETKRWTAVLGIVTVYIPVLLTVGWFVIVAYLAFWWQPKPGS